MNAQGKANEVTLESSDCLETAVNNKATNEMMVEAIEDIMGLSVMERDMVGLCVIGFNRLCYVRHFWHYETSVRT